MVALADEDLSDCSCGRRRHRHGGFIGLDLKQRLSRRHLIAFMDQDVHNIAAFDSLREKRQFHLHRPSPL